MVVMQSINITSDSINSFCSVSFLKSEYISIVCQLEGLCSLCFLTLSAIAWSVTTAVAMYKTFCEYSFAFNSANVLLPLLAPPITNVTLILSPYIIYLPLTLVLYHQYYKNQTKNWGLFFLIDFQSLRTVPDYWLEEGVKFLLILIDYLI